MTQAEGRKGQGVEAGSHRRTKDWLWSLVNIAREFHQQKINRQEFDRTLKGKLQVLGPNMQLPKGSDPHATPAPVDPTVPAAPATREKRKQKKKKKKEDLEVPATGTGGKGGSTPITLRTPRGGRGGKGDTTRDTTPRSEQARRASQMTKEEKAKTPCMFYAFGSCKAAKCECKFLHNDSNKYTSPPPRSLATHRQMLRLSRSPSQSQRLQPPLLPSSMPCLLLQRRTSKITWIWDTGAGRHLIRKQALNHKAAAFVRRTDSPVGFATGGGAREENQTLSFEGSRLFRCMS